MFVCLFFRPAMMFVTKRLITNPSAAAVCLVRSNQSNHCNINCEWDCSFWGHDTTCSFSKAGCKVTDLSSTLARQQIENIRQSKRCEKQHLPHEKLAAVAFILFFIYFYGSFLAPLFPIVRPERPPGWVVTADVPPYLVALCDKSQIKLGCILTAFRPKCPECLQLNWRNCDTAAGAQSS